MATQRKHPNVPNYRELMIPALKAIKELGGSGTTQEINEKAIEIARISDDVAEVSHDGGSITEVEYQLAWSRTYLKNAGLIVSTRQGVWRLVTIEINPDKIDVAETLRNARKGMSSRDEDESGKEDHKDENDWREVLLTALQQMDPDAFERLTQLILRESGFTHVEVRGKSGDGGIDGIGILKLNNVLSFHVYFQCKRYSNAVSAGAVRDFRGAMHGRSDKGLLITTGRFTRDAQTEAKREGATPIELIDGPELCELMKDLRLGVQVEMVERINVASSWLDTV